MLSGLMGKKIGMTQIFREDGTAEAITAVEAGPCVVTQIKTAAKEGYNAIQLGFAEVKRLNSPEKGHLKNLGMFKHLQEFRVADPSDLKLGQKVDAGLFEKGDLVDIIGISKGRGFAGGVKRHHFRGGPKTHGQSDRHRAPGSIGAGTTPGRVLKGRRMAGHMGNQRVTAKHLEVIEADPERSLLLLKGTVPGARNGLLTIKKSGRGSE